MSKNRNYPLNVSNEESAGNEVPEYAENAENIEASPTEDISDNSGKAENPVAAAKNPAALVYIGPTIFRTRLVSGRVFITGGKPIDEILSDDLLAYPLARQMFVPPAQTAEAMEKIHNTGTALGNAYKRLLGGKS